MGLLKDKKIIVFGEVVAVPTQAITECLKATGVKEEDIVLRTFECLG